MNAALIQPLERSSEIIAYADDVVIVNGAARFIDHRKIDKETEKS